MENMIENKTFQMFLEDSKERDLLLKIKQDQFTDEELDKLTTDLLQRIEQVIASF